MPSSIKILHTSDWHLGASLGPVSRADDHDLFLGWLAKTLVEQQVDVLLVAGDLFDQQAPSAESLRQYYRFLHNIAGTWRGQVVLVGGNHDSAARLDAPAELLAAFQVRVVGGLANPQGDLDNYLVPLGLDGAVHAVVLAIPYVHEYRLGVRAALGDSGNLSQLLREGFADLYRRATDRALALYGDVPLLATGHMACAGNDKGIAPQAIEKGDAPQEIHLIGTLGVLPASIFDPRLQYVALGHIHRGYQVAERVHYSGTPVALSAKEALIPRRVLLVTTTTGAGQAATVERLLVPVFRDVVELRGNKDSVTKQIGHIQSAAPLPPLVQAVVEVDGFAPGLVQDLTAALPAGARLVEVRQERKQIAQVDAKPVLAPLRQLSAQEVFKLLCARQQETVDEPLLTAFLSLLQDEATAQGDRP
jgi:exonuclease SbcD